MKIAVTYENGSVFQHFGHCGSFKLYEVEGNNVISSEIVGAVGSGHGALTGFLQGHGVNALVCGGIGAGARTALDRAGITIYPGVSGAADDCVAALLAGKLAYDPEATCHHHDEAHAAGSHDCGSHDCGGGCGEDKGGCAGNH